MKPQMETQYTDGYGASELHSITEETGGVSGSKRDFFLCVCESSLIVPCG